MIDAVAVQMMMVSMNGSSSATRPSRIGRSVRAALEALAEFRIV
jgi:hypothetical protein